MELTVVLLRFLKDVGCNYKGCLFGHMVTNGCEEVMKFSVTTSVLTAKVPGGCLWENCRVVCEMALIMVIDQ